MSVADNVSAVREDIAEACIRSGRDVDDVVLMAVTKNQGVSMVREAYEAGVRCFGENRVQEAAEKYTEMPEDADLQLVGHLQRNKAKDACNLFSTVQSIDRVETGDALHRQCVKHNRRMRVLIEVNTSGEENKYGVQGSDAALALMDGLLELETLEVAGFMTLAPFTENEQAIRKSFRELGSTAREVARHHPDLDLSVLSMGMSNDYRIAVEEGSTMVRVGTRLFGERS